MSYLLGKPVSKRDVKYHARVRQRLLWNEARKNCFNSTRLVIKLIGPTNPDVGLYSRLNSSCNRGSPIRDADTQARLEQLASIHGKALMQAMAINRKINLKWYKAREKPSMEV